MVCYTLQLYSLYPAQLPCPLIQLTFQADLRVPCQPLAGGATPAAAALSRFGVLVHATAACAVITVIITCFASGVVACAISARTMVAYLDTPFDYILNIWSNLCL